MTDVDSCDPDTTVVGERMPVDQWLAIRTEAALKFDPMTAEVFFHWGLVIDPYGIFSDLTDEERQVGRVYFARSPESDVWVSFYDLPDEIRDELWRKARAGAYPDARPGPLDLG